MPQAVKHVGVISYVHRVSAVGQAREAIVAAAVSGRAGYDVTPAIAQYHRDAQINNGFATLNAVGVHVVPDCAADRVRQAGLVTEVRRQINRGQGGQIAPGSAIRAAVRIYAVHPAVASVGQSVYAHPHDVSCVKRQSPETIMPVYVGHGRGEQPFRSMVVEGNRHALQGLIARAICAVAIGVQEDRIADQARGRSLARSRVAKVLQVVARRRKVRHRAQAVTGH